MGFIIFILLILGGIGCMVLGAYLSSAFSRRAANSRRGNNVYLLPERRER